MNEQARGIWKTPEGVGLLRKMLAGGPLDERDRQTLNEIPESARIRPSCLQIAYRPTGKRKRPVRELA